MEVSLPRGSTVSDAVARIRQEVPNGMALPERPMTAVNLEQVGSDRVIAEGDEIALLPPLAGG